MDGSTLVKYNGTKTRVEIPDTVERIGSGAFKNCTKVVSVIMPDSVKRMADSVFDGCVSLEEVKLSASLKKIGYKTFNDCESLKSITIPENVSELMNSALTCGLTEITFESSITTWELENEYTAGSFHVDRKGNGDGVSKLIFGSNTYSAAELYRHKSIANYLISLDLCIHCGGKFNIFGKCKNCGRKKDY